MKARLILLTALLLPCSATATLRADPPKILEFRTQSVDGKVYFHVRLARPKDMAGDNQRMSRRFDPWGDMMWSDPTLSPRLVPQDGAARLVYGRETMTDRFGRPFDDDKKVELDPKDKEFDEKKDPKNEKDLKAKDKDGPDTRPIEFYGFFTGKKEATLVLIYPKDPGERDRKKKLSLLELLQQKDQWIEEKVTLDPAKGKKVAMPAQGFRRDGNRQVEANDLEGNWAVCQASHFARLADETPDFGFYSFAHETTCRLYKVNANFRNWMPGRFRFHGDHKHGEAGRLFEITTGAAAITESLALERMRNNNPIKEKEEARTVPIADVRGIDIDEHPWKKMIGSKKAALEPLAELVPHDNYYIRFKTFDKFLETGDLLDQWGTSIARAMEVNARDHRIKQKLETQLCLKSTGLARVFGPAVIKSLAITGNDPYLREGSDFTIVFQLSNKTLFESGAEPTLLEARKKYGKLLKEDKTVHQDITIESFVTPLREISLHRAYFGDYAVYSNSGVAVRRIIDAHKGKGKRLSDALDFQYMRTIFRADDPEEDGFVFLSDAFIRNLVGPRVRIKERRRLEALTSMSMLTNGAMYTAWETGKPAQNFQHIIQATGMKLGELFSPDGNAVTWDETQKVAISSFYNTQHFATPLVEIPIDNVTPTEQREYEMFRAQYLGLWRQYFDPIGMRLSLKKDQVKLDTYILPLVRTTQYNELRRIAGDGTIKIDSTMFSDKTLLKYLMHVSPQVFDRDLFGGAGSDLMVDLALRSWLGDWFAVRFDDSPVYAKLLESYIRSQMFPDERHDFIADMELALQIPVTIGFDVRSPVAFAGLLTGVRKAVENTLPGAIEWGPMKEPYKGTHIVRIKANGERIGRVIAVGDERRLNPEFYYAMVDGAFFISLREDPIKDIIDKSVAIKERKDKGEKVEVNSSLFLGPKAAVKSKDLLKQYLEWETHRRVQINNRLLYAMFKSNVIGPGDDSPAIEAATLQYLGFVPVSPDLAPFRYDPLKEEVVNERHGSLRQPKLNAGVDAKSPMGRLLEEFATIRADLRFREDGIHTTLTMKRNVPSK